MVHVDHIAPLEDRCLDVVEIDLLRPAWMRDAACRGAGAAVWFTINDAGDDGDRARRVCSSCGVQHECLDYALDARIRYGIWGGLSGRERATLERRRRSAGGGSRVA